MNRKRIKILKHPFYNSDTIQIEEKYEDDILSRYTEFYKSGDIKFQLLKLEKGTFSTRSFRTNNKFKSASFADDTGREGEDITAYYRLKKNESKTHKKN